MTVRRSPGRPKSEDTLTPAEWRVVDAIRHGLTGPQIAARRGISVEAVKYHVKNALQKLGLRDRRALRQWTGVPRNTALHGKEKPMSTDTKLGPIHQLARPVIDIEEAKNWYGEVLGLRLLYAFPRLAFFDCGGVRLFLEQTGRAMAASIIYFRADDIRAAHEDLQSRGVAFTSAPHIIHRHPDGVEEWLAFFEDNEGRPLAIMSQVSP